VMLASEGFQIAESDFFHFYPRSEVNLDL